MSPIVVSIIIFILSVTGVLKGLADRSGARSAFIAFAAVIVFFGALLPAIGIGDIQLNALLILTTLVMVTMLIFRFSQIWAGALSALCIAGIIFLAEHIWDIGEYALPEIIYAEMVLIVLVAVFSCENPLASALTAAFASYCLYALAVLERLAFSSSFAYMDVRSATFKAALTALVAMLLSDVVLYFKYRKRLSSSTVQ